MNATGHWIAAMAIALLVLFLIEFVVVIEIRNIVKSWRVVMARDGSVFLQLVDDTVTAVGDLVTAADSEIADLRTARAGGTLTDAQFDEATSKLTNALSSIRAATDALKADDAPTAPAAPAPETGGGN